VGRCLALVTRPLTACPSVVRTRLEGRSDSSTVGLAGDERWANEYLPLTGSQSSGWSLGHCADVYSGVGYMLLLSTDEVDFEGPWRQLNAVLWRRRGRSMIEAAGFLGMETPMELLSAHCCTWSRG
jgi:hypothetical protein